MKTVVRPLFAAALAFALALAALALPADAHADVTAPPNPTFVTAASYACRRVDIGWHNDFDNGSGLAYYNLYRRDVGATVQPMGSVTGDVSPFLAARRRMIWYMEGTGFQVGIQGVDRAGNVSAITWSQPITMPTPSSPTCQDVYRPSLPSGLAATLTGGTCAEVVLTWIDDASDAGFVSTGVRGYNVYRDNEWLYFKSRPGVMRQEDRFGLVPGQTYTYSIKTIDNAGFESATFTSVSIAIPADCRHRVPSGDRSIDVLGVRFPDQPAAPLYTMAQLDTKLFADIPGGPVWGTSARAFFTETSYGARPFTSRH